MISGSTLHLCVCVCVCVVCVCVCGGGGGGGGNEPEFSVNGIFSSRDCQKQSANFIL